MTPLRVLLVGNYLADKQQSMQRFADCLAAGLSQRGVSVTRIAPRKILGRFSQGTLGKWLGYIDKFALFMPRLWWISRAHDVVHIGDHSNAMYTWAAPQKTLVTCHDLLAVRGALGEATDCPASFTGRLLQQWIVFGLGRAKLLAAVSNYTRNDLVRLVPRQTTAKLVYNGLNHPFRVLSANERTQRRSLLEVDLGTIPFALHIGSNLTRKNRVTAVRAVARAVARGWNGRLLLAGHAPDAALTSEIAHLGLVDRILALPDVGNDELELLYNEAHALIFPSRFEGFGWPLIEAQACGCPVIASSIPPFVEIAGGSARLHNSDDAEAMADDLLELTDPVQRTSMITGGLANSERFRLPAMIDGYMQCYAAIAQRT